MRLQLVQWTLDVVPYATHGQKFYSSEGWGRLHLRGMRYSQVAK